MSKEELASYTTAILRCIAYTTYNVLVVIGPCPTLHFPDKPKLVTVPLSLSLSGSGREAGPSLVHFHTSYENISLQCANLGSSNRFIYLL